MVIADTGLWIALAYSQDQYHELAKKCLAELSTRNERLITTCAVMTETCHLLLARAGGDAQLNFIFAANERKSVAIGSPASTVLALFASICG